MEQKRDRVTSRFKKESTGGARTLREKHRVKIDAAKEGAFQSTIIVVREVDATGETPQEVQGIQGQTARLFLATGILDKMRNPLRSKLSLKKSKFLNP